jgi:hypothetical protein
VRMSDSVRPTKRPGRPGRKLLAQVEGENEIVRQVLHGTGEITLRAVDPPYWLGNPKHFDWSPAHGASMVLPNLGTKETPLLISIRAPAAGVDYGNASPGLGLAAEPMGALTEPRLNVGGKVFKWAGSLDADDELVVDTGTFEVTLNGENALSGWTGTFPKLPAGGATLTHTDRFQSGAIYGFDLSERFT